MGRKKVEQTDSYIAADEEGNTHTVIVFTEFIEITPLNGQAQWLPGITSHKTQNGNHVNVNNDGSLLNVQTGKVMRRI